MEAYAVLGDARRERRRVRTVLVAALNRLVGDEPRVPPAAHVPPAGRPPVHIRSVLVLHPDRAAIQRRPSIRRELEDEFLAVVDEAIAVDRLVVADIQVPRQPGARASR